MNEYFPKPKSLGVNKKVEFYLCNYIYVIMSNYATNQI